MADKIVSFAAGHGGFGVTPGKRGPDGKYEWDWNNGVVVAAIAHLKNYIGVKAIRVDDPTGRTDVPLNTRVARANAANSDFHSDVHHNALGSKWFDGPGGIETFVMQGTSSSAGAMKAAKEIHPRIVNAMGLRDRGIKQANFQMLRSTKMPAVLTEGGFMDSRIDRQEMDNLAKIKAQGIALAEGIAAYLNLSKNTSAPVHTKEEVVQVSKNYLIEGDKGVQVKELQKDLNAVGNKLDVDGIYGAATVKAVTAFQKKYKLAEDGVAGKKTIAKLNDVIADAKKPAPVKKPAAAPKSVDYRVDIDGKRVGVFGELSNIQNQVESAYKAGKEFLMAPKK